MGVRLADIHLSQTLRKAGALCTGHHQHGRWQARIGRGTQEEAAEAYDMAAIKCPRTTPTSNPTMDYQTADSEHVLKRSRPFEVTDEANNLPVNMLPVAYPNQSHGQSSYSSNDLPKSVVMTLRPGSTVKSMDFHPMQQILLLVGTNMGDVMLYELPSHEKIAIKNFKVWDLGACSAALQQELQCRYKISVIPDKTFIHNIGCDYSKFQFIVPKLKQFTTTQPLLYFKHNLSCIF
nr:topless-related protein 4-like isoform X3 [Malus domestica]